MNQTANITEGVLSVDNSVVKDRMYMHRKQEVLKVCATYDMEQDYIPIIEYNANEKQVWS